MLELTVSAFVPLIVIVCIITIAVIIAIYSFVTKRKYKQKADAVAAKTKQLAAALDELFKPVKRTSQEEVDHFLADNQEVICKQKGDVFSIGMK